MGLISKITNLFRPRVIQSPPRVIRAKYDAAQTTSENTRHWANADALSAREANSLAVRKKIRERARYEVANNSYAKGITLTLANTLIGSGVRLQISTPDDAVNSAIESRWAKWSRSVRMADQLRTMKLAKTGDGEAFAIIATNDLVNDSVKLDIRLIEADQVTSATVLRDQREIDGIWFDDFGNPVRYDVLRQHPGDAITSRFEFDPLPSRRVIHWFRCDRPGQVRGVSEIASALPLFALLRRFTLASITAAEVAACFAAILQTQSAPEGAELVTPFDTWEIERGMMTNAPAGYELKQLESKHPNSTYDMVVYALVREICRCVNLPVTLALLDSSKSNFSSSRLDHLIYRSACEVERQDCEREVLDPIFSEWLNEAVMIPGYLPPASSAFLSDLPHSWHWDPWPAIDQITEAQADTERLTNGTATLATVTDDWRGLIRQQAIEEAYRSQVRAELGQGATMPTQTPATMAATIKAATKPAKFYFTAGKVTVEAASEPKTIPTVDILAYTGGPMSLPGFQYPVIVDLAGMIVPSQNRPLLRDHKHWKVVGHTQEIINDGSTLRARGLISGTGPDAREVLANSQNQFPWQASIGADAEQVEFYDPNQTVSVNGQQFTGPVYVARRTTLREISFVPLGADGNTSAAVAASNEGQTMTFEQWCLGFMTIEEFSALDETAKAALQKAFDAQNAPNETEETPPADGVPPMPAAAGGSPVPAAASAARPTMNTAQVTSNLQAQRRAEASETARVNGIRRLCAAAGNPTLSLGGNRTVDLAAHAISEGWTESHAKREVEREAELTALRNGRKTPFGFSVSSTPAVTTQTIEAALCSTLRIKNIEKHFDERTLEAAHKQFRGRLGLQQCILLAAAANGYPVGPGERITSGNIKSIFKAAFMIEAGFSTVSLPGVFGNVANKELLMGYEEGDQTWREVAKVASVPDFKTLTRYRMNDDLEYEQLGPAGEIKHGTLGEESYTSKAKTYAKMLTLTREDQINDDLGAFDDLRTRLGVGAIQKFNKIFWTEFMSDASTFWTSTRTNYISGSTTNLGTDGVGLGLGVKAFRQMTSPSADGAKRIGGNPEILLVPPELETIAQQLYENTNLGAGTTVANANIFARKYRPVVSVWLSDSAYTGYSTTAWYLLRNPQQWPAVVASFLDGVETPTVESADADFNTLGIQFRGYHDFGVDQAEYLCGVKSKGAA